MTSARRPLPWWLLAPAAVGAGLSASAAFAPIGWWPCAVLAVAVLAWVVARSGGLRASVGLGWLFGLAFMGTSLVWQTSILVLSYSLLTLVTSLVYAGVAGLVRLVRPLPAAPVWAAAAWSVGEWVIATWPFDGFGWMRLGYAMVDSPLAGFYPFTGAAAVSFLVALLGSLLAWLALEPGRRRAAVAVAAAVGVLVLGAAGTGWEPRRTASGQVTVGWAQGGAPGGGVYGLGEARTITFNQGRQTVDLVERVEAGDLPAPDFIVWPENSTDLDPRRDAATRTAVEAAVERAGVPILVGSIFEDPERDERQTIALWWTPEAGVTETYAKRNLVPFGEWIPFREVLLPLVPELRYVGAQSVPGTEPGSLEVGLPDGRLIDIGVAICYEVIYPHTMYDALTAGAQVFFVQSSNAMYQGTNQIDQQFAITRVRAAEMRSEILVVTTSGVSGRIGTRGETLWTAPSSQGASGVEVLDLAITRTPAMGVGRIAEPALVGAGLAALAAAAWRARRPARGGRMDVAPGAVPVA